MDDNNGQVPSFEKSPDSEVGSEREVAPEEDFAEAMKDAPEFGAEDAAELDIENVTEFNEGIANAEELIKYGLDAAARELGVETVVQKLKGFDFGGRENPIGDFYEYLGMEAPRQQVSGSVEGASKAVADMKELISEVEGADPRYEELRAGARGAGKGYFEYAVSQFGTQGLTELFGVLTEQRERKDKVVQTAGNEAIGAKSEVIDAESEAIDAEDEAFEAKNEDIRVEDESRETLNSEILQKQM